MGKLIDTLSFMYGYLCIIGGAVIAYAFGGWTKGLDVLLVLIVLDIITGLCASAAESRRNPNDPTVGISSKKYKKGFLNKVWIFVVIGLLHRIDGLFGIDPSDPSISFMTAAIYFYISNELLSLTENFGRIGVPMPSFMKQIITVFKEKGSSTTISTEKEDEKTDDQTK